jgi:hypothetical protein
MATEAVKARATALIQHTHTKWQESDRAVLEAMSEAQLAYLEPDEAALAALQAQETRKAALITALVGNSWCVLSESTLKGMSVEDLEKLTTMGPQEASYAGQGLPVTRTAGDEDSAWQPLSILTKKEVASGR